MKLADWIEREGIKRKDVAEALSVSPSYVTMLCSETPNWPGRDLIGRINELTSGAVSANDFLPPVPVPEGQGQAA